MANYKKMYAILCGAIDDVLDDLNRIRDAQKSAGKLQKALLDAEEMYVEAEEIIRNISNSETKTID